MKIQQLPRLPLLTGPTPVHSLPSLSARLGGPTVWIKRDDLTPMVMGGNKLRKLEFLLGEARHTGADVVVTLGAVQSNHAAQTAAAACRYGMDAVLLLHGPADAARQGNLLLDTLYSAEIRLNPDPPADWGMQVVEELRAAGRRPYLIPVGGSNPVGAAGYFLAGLELQRQLDVEKVMITEVIVASASGGTQAGLVLAASLGAPWKLLGISVSRSGDELAQAVLSLSEATAAHLELPLPAAPLVQTTGDYVGSGYAQLDDATHEAVTLLANQEGLLVDPVYTGKALGGLIDLVRRGRWRRDEHVLFWHTGGLPALFAYGPQLLTQAV
ncbi:MAG: D-cysteine desulfhydrase family protein [Ardenticatenaceae bacterium]|nr:D-cysteine desulfhydrase family protein [Ardenticatenaceae bacterium]HBY93108.1 D-cysteine desulfhydrase family protein [Chloroflexota bacterium]